MKKLNLWIVNIMIALTALSGCSSEPKDNSSNETKGYEQDSSETVLFETTEDSNFYATWASSQYQAESSNQPPLSLSGNSLRQVIHTSVGGDKIRVKFSNLVGEKALSIKEAHIAKTVSKTDIDLNTDTKITFDGNSECSIAAGKELYSDLLDFSFDDLDCLTVTIYFDSVPTAITGHMGSRTTSYVMEDNHAADESFNTKYSCEHWYVLAAVDVYTTNVIRTVSCFGDSITDGRGSTTDKQNRWTDILSERLLENDSTKYVSVVNEGIGGTCLTSSGISRFDRDVIKNSGSYYAIMLYGINDIIYLNSSKDTIIETYKSLIKKAHKNNIIIYGGTILPFGNCSDYTKERNEVRLAVNEWIMNTKSEDGGFDGYIDFATLMASESDSNKMNSSYDSSDGLHPSAAGYKAMGDAIPLSFLTRRIDDCKSKWPASAGSVTVTDTEIFKFSLPESVAADETVEIEVKGVNNGTKGFRIWLTDGSNSDCSNIYKFEDTGSFDIKEKLTATKTSSYLLFKGIQYGTNIEDLTINSLSVTINGAITSIDVADEIIK